MNPGLQNEVISLKSQLEAARGDLSLVKEAMLQLQTASQLRLQEMQERFAKEVGENRERVNQLQQQLSALQNGT